MAKKTSSKKTVSKKAAAPDEGPEQASRENIKFFMAALIGAGHIKSIPEDSPGQNAEAQRLRQFAERLANQLRKFS